MNLTGNSILITGGASGIGLELAKQLHAMGNKVILTGRDQVKLDKAKASLAGSVTIQCDVTKVESIKQLHGTILKSHPDVNILINNAGIMKTINLHDQSGSLEDLTFEIDTNLSAPIRLVKLFLPHLKSKKEAAIVNVSSGLAFVPLPVSPVYCATKAALHSYTQSLRAQLKNTTVKVFELAPPATQTELLSEFNSEDMKGITIMKLDDMVRVAVKGMQSDRFEIRPGQSNQLRFMSRLAPEFILSQMSKTVDRMLTEPGH